jgi:hypothetical protein
MTSKLTGAGHFGDRPFFYRFQRGLVESVAFTSRHANMRPNRVFSCFLRVQRAGLGLVARSCTPSNTLCNSGLFNTLAGVTVVRSQGMSPKYQARQKPSFVAGLRDNSSLNLETAVGRARVGCAQARWQGTTTTRALAR